MTKRTIWLVILLFITNLCSYSVEKLDWSKTKYKNVDEWIQFGKKHLRRAYRHGGSGPYAFDCSGFTLYMYKELGYELPHSSSAQSSHGEKIKSANVKPGDLVFYAGSKGSSIGHVGIVIESNEDEFSFIHASLKQGICIDKSTHPYYKSRYKTARRVFDMTIEEKHKKKEKEVEKTPVPAPEKVPEQKPKEEPLELPGQTPEVDNKTTDNNVVNNKKDTPKEKENRRERRKREKAEKQRLEKENAAKKKQEEARKNTKNESQNINQNTKKETQKEVKKETKKETHQKEVTPVVAKKTHVVEKGETMYRISKMAGLTVDELKEINGLKTNDLSIGQILIIEK